MVASDPTRVEHLALEGRRWRVRVCADAPTLLSPRAFDILLGSRCGDCKSLPGNERGLVSRIFASWNQLDKWLRRVEVLRRASRAAPAVHCNSTYGAR